MYTELVFYIFKILNCGSRDSIVVPEFNLIDCGIHEKVRRAIRYCNHYRGVSGTQVGCITDLYC
jgi:hypothetical protein